MSCKPSLSLATTKALWKNRSQGANAAWYRAKAKVKRTKLRKVLSEQMLAEVKASQKENFNSGIMCK